MLLGCTGPECLGMWRVVVVFVVSITGPDWEEAAVARILRPDTGLLTEKEGISPSQVASDPAQIMV